MRDYLKNIRSRLFGWLLVAMFLSGQTLAFAHQFDHDSLTGSDHCVQCLTQSHLDDTAPLAGPVEVPVTVEQFTGDADSRDHLLLTLRTHQARAPPQTL